MISADVATLQMSGCFEGAAELQRQEPEREPCGA